MNNFVKFFRGSSPYINAHRGKVFVLALSGEAIAHDNFIPIVHDIALLHHLGIKLVLVHGARHQIDARLAQADLQTPFVNNRRVTSPEALRYVKEAIGGTRIEIESKFSAGLSNSPMAGSRIRLAGANVVTAKPLGVRDGVNFHHTGEVRRIDKEAIQQFLSGGDIVLISSLGYSPTGETFNLNYDEVATQVAITLKAEKLMLFSDHSGVTDVEGNLKKIIPISEVPGLLHTAALQGADLADIQSCYHACLNGVERAHIISYLDDGALLKELFTRDGTGTLVMKHALETLRTATIDDVGGLLELISPLEQAGVLVKRSREMLENEISRFTVVVDPEQMLIACAALYPFNGGSAAELACVVTHPDFQRQGLATRLLEALEEHARRQGMTELFVLTTQTAHWFKEHGFEDSDVQTLPVEKQQCYNYQRNSSVLKKTL